MSDEQDIPSISNLLESLDIISRMLDTELKMLADFAEAHDQNVDFWHRYAMERTSDKKLQQIAAGELKTKDAGKDIVESISSDVAMIKKCVAAIPGILAQK